MEHITDFVKDIVLDLHARGWAGMRIEEAGHSLAAGADQNACRYCGTTEDLCDHCRCCPDCHCLIYDEMVKTDPQAIRELAMACLVLGYVEDRDDSRPISNVARMGLSLILEQAESLETMHTAAAERRREIDAQDSALAPPDFQDIWAAALDELFSSGPDAATADDDDDD